MAAFVAACRAEVLSERTIEFYLEGLNSYRAFAGADERDLRLADLDVDTGRAWLGAIIGWVADLLADGTKPTDLVFLRDGSACGQAEATERLALDPSLLYPTRDEAVRDGLARLRAADATIVGEPDRDVVSAGASGQPLPTVASLILSLP